jgi:hypothetical protein
VSRDAIAFWVIVALHTIIGLFVLAPEAVYSGDIGVKYVQARALADQRFTSLNIPYPAEFLDPAREFFPIVPPFVMHTGGETQAIFSPTSAVLQAGAAEVAGIRGLVAVSLVAGALALFGAWRLVPRELGLPLLVTLGIGSPLWFYAVSGWEHAPAIAFGTLAFTVAVRSHHRHAAIASGLLIGAGATLRDETLLLAPGLLLVWLLRERAARQMVAVAATAAGVVLPLALAAALEVWWFERPAAAHLRHAVHILQVAAGVTSEPNPDVPALQPFTLRDRYETVINYWIAGSGTNLAIAGFAVALVAGIVLQSMFGTSAGLLAIALGIAAIAVLDAVAVIAEPKWPAGFVRVAPYIVLALFPAPRAGSRNGWLPSAIAVTTLAYLAVAFIGTDTSGGKSLGPRLLMPLMPLLAVAAVMRIGEYFRGNRLDRAVAMTGAVLVVLAVLIHTLGTFPAYRIRNRQDAKAVLVAGAAPERVIVADDPFTAQLLFPLYYRKIILLADTVAEGNRIGQLLTDQRIASVLVVSREPGTVTLLPLRFESSELAGRITIERWRRRY